MNRQYRLLLAFLLGGFMGGCPLLIHPQSQEIPDGQRLITGELLTPREDDFNGATNQGMVLAALLGNPEGNSAELIVGTPFNPSQVGAAGGDRVRFNLLVPADRSAALFFQTPPTAGSGNFLGVFLAKVAFPADATGEALVSIVPPGEEKTILDLGLVKIDALDRSTNADNLAIPEENPLNQIDSDGDGTPDVLDADDDADGVPDAEDDDDDDDGVIDAALQAELDALTETAR